MILKKLKQFPQNDHKPCVKNQPRSETEAEKQPEGPARNQPLPPPPEAPQRGRVRRGTFPWRGKEEAPPRGTREEEEEEDPQRQPDERLREREHPPEGGKEKGEREVENGLRQLRDEGERPPGRFGSASGP